MIWYLGLATFPLFLLPIINTLNKEPINATKDTQKIFLFLFGLALFLMIALRSNSVGSGDSLVYYEKWKLLKNFSYRQFELYTEDSKMEYGFLFFVWFFSRLGGSAQLLFVITGLVFSFSVCRFIYLNAKDTVLSSIMFVCLGLYTFMAQGMRQAIAMSICLWATEAGKNRKLLKFVLIVLFAAVFHRTAIIFLAVYFLYGIKLNATTVMVAFGIGLVLLASSVPLANLANKLLGREYEGTFEEGGFVAVAIYVLIIVAALILQKQKDKKNFDFYFLMTFAGFIFFLMRYTGVTVAERVSFYFMFGQIILLPNVIQSMDRNSRIIAKIVVAVLSIALFAYRLRGTNLIPFLFFWQ